MQRASFELSTAENMKITALCDVTPRILIGDYRSFVGTSCLLVLDKDFSYIIKMETAFFSETSTNYKSSRRHIPENYLFVT